MNNGNNAGRSPEERFWAKVEKTDTCWLWTAARDRYGYGLFSSAGLPTRLVHRIAWMWLQGPIPDGLVIDHLCRVRACVNPAHLRVVTTRENTLAVGSMSPSAIQAKQAHCKNGHLLSGDNLYRAPGSTHTRRCRTCTNQASRDYKRRRRARAKLI